MNKETMMGILHGKDTKERVAQMKELLAFCEKSDDLYPYFDEYIKALEVKTSYTHVRAFRLVMAQAKWDREDKIDRHMEQILAILQDDKPTVVRMTVGALGPIGLYKKGLIPRVMEALNALDSTRYSENMQGLIQKDIEQMLGYLAGQKVQ